VPLLLAAHLFGACGDGDTTLLVTVHLSRQVPDQIDAVHFSVADDLGVLSERTFALPSGATEASLLMVRGSRTPERLRVAAYAMLGATIVAQTAEQEVAFIAGETREVDLEL
jgi:hypothetical protein